MKASFGPILTTLAALAVIAPASAGSTAFKGNVCKLVPSKVVAAIQGMSSACSEQPPLPAPGAKDYEGTWKGLTPTASLQITIEVFSDQGILKIATHNLNQGLLAGTPQKVSGIGEAAYVAKG